MTVKIKTLGFVRLPRVLANKYNCFSSVHLLVLQALQMFVFRLMYKCMCNYAYAQRVGSRCRALADI